jgi:Uma2 family endonuclease
MKVKGGVITADREASMAQIVEEVLQEIVDPAALGAPPCPFLSTDTASPWPEQGQWTYADYLRLPDDGKRYEIIAGVLYMVNAPGFDHQYAVSEIHLQMGSFVKSGQLGIVLTAPFEIHLSETTRPVQPDVLFIAAAHKPQAGARFFAGIPDLVVEVLSAGSVRLDRVVKFATYERAGVPEYWIVDLGTHTVEVYALDEQGFYTQLGQFHVGEKTRSIVLKDVALPVADLFGA